MQTEVIQLFLRRAVRAEIHAVTRKDLADGIRRVAKGLEHRRIDRTLLGHGRHFLLGADDAVRLEPHAGELFGELQNFPVRVRAAERGAREDILHGVRLADACAEPPHEKARLHAGSSLVYVRLVQNDILQLRAGKHAVVLGSEHHVFQHGVVGDEDVRRVRLHFLAGDKLVRERINRRARSVLMRFPVFAQRLAAFMLRVAVVYSEADLAEIPEKRAHALDLVVGQSVHRVDDDRTHAGIEFAVFQLRENVLDDGDQEAFRFAGARAGGDDQIFSGVRLPESVFLMQIQRPLELQLPFLFGDRFQLFKKMAGLSGIHQLAQRAPGHIGAANVQIRPLGRHPFALQLFSEQLGVRLVRYIEACRYVIDIAVFYLFRGLYGIKHIQSSFAS